MFEADVLPNLFSGANYHGQGFELVFVSFLQARDIGCPDLFA